MKKYSFCDENDSAPSVVHETNRGGEYNAIFIALLAVYPALLNGWGLVLSFGFREAIVSTFIMGSASICLSLCVAEMTSILPFSGGSYGFVRVTLGPYFGFLVGCLEILHTVAYPAFLIHRHGILFNDIFGDNAQNFAPLIFVFLFMVILLANSRSKKIFSNIMKCGGCLTIVIVLLYFSVSIYNINNQEYSHLEHDKKWFSGGIPEFLSLLPRPFYQFRGIELLPLICSELDDPKQQMPILIVSLSVMVFALSFILLSFGAGQAPGVIEISSDLNPSSFALANAFQISRNSAQLITATGSVFTYITYGFLFSRQQQAMASSGLFPEILSKQRTHYSTPHWALLLGCGIGFTACILSRYLFENLLLAALVIGFIGSFLSGIAMLISFIILRKKFSNLERKFRNPVGIISAIYGMIVFFLASIGSFLFLEIRYAVLGLFFGFLIIISAYYYAFARNNQGYSAQEESILFVLYVMKANKNRRKRATIIRSNSKLSQNSGSRSNSAAINRSNSELLSINSGYNSNTGVTKSIRSNENCRSTAYELNEIDNNETSSEKYLKGSKIVPVSEFVYNQNIDENY